MVPELAALAAHPALGVAAALDPFGAARVVGAAADAVAGPSGLVAAVAGCARVGTGAHVAAEAYRVVETGAERLASAVWRAVAPTVVPPAVGAAVLGAPVLAGTAAVAVALSASAWVVVRSAPVVAGAAARAAGLVAGGDLDATAARALVSGAADEVVGRLAADATAAALAVQVQAARHPWPVREGLTALPVAVGALVPDVVERLLAVPVEVAGGADPVPGSVPEVAALLAVAAGAAGYLRQGDVRVAPAGPPRRTTGAHDVAGLADRLRPFAPPTTATATGPYTPGRVRVDRVDGPDGRRWVVYLPPTQTWSTGGGPLPADGTANLRLAGGLDADALEAAREAMVRAGVRPDDPVLAVGYSQGGMTAAALAVDPVPVGDVQAVVTMGSPVSHVPLPADVVVLSLENGGDLTPDVDGALDPDRRTWTSVEHARPVDTAYPWSAHEIGAYAATAGLVDASDHPSLVAWRAQVAPFLDPRAEVVSQEISTLRGPP